MAGEAPRLEFKPVNLERDSIVCLEFMEDGYRVAFGDPARFEKEAGGKGGNRYLEGLREALAIDPWGSVHAWLDGKIVGQIELAQCRRDPSLGYIGFVYLRPEFRGLGLSDQLNRYMNEYFIAKGYKGALVSVARKNVRAVKFYEKFGYVYDSARSDIPELDFMKLTFPNDEAGRGRRG